MDTCLVWTLPIVMYLLLWLFTTLQWLINQTEALCSRLLRSSVWSRYGMKNMEPYSLHLFFKVNLHCVMFACRKIHRYCMYSHWAAYIKCMCQFSNPTLNGHKRCWVSSESQIKSQSEQKYILLSVLLSFFLSFFLAGRLRLLVSCPL